ncbi:uncharacterized protein LOC143046219 [Mytilus galloprovincialis]|uniref:uncharacterized protein LOC143046219 n=1 Tax=Mytilus galloprovincialis TaxID=29158 RepID=UPI003F7BBBF2
MDVLPDHLNATMIGSVDASQLNRELKQYINELIKQASRTRQGCQSGVFGEHAYPEIKFPASGYITFNPPFTATPALVYGLYLYDSSKNTNSRLVTSVSNLSKSGFNLKISTFAGTKMWGARISWMACPKSFEN